MRALAPAVFGFSAIALILGACATAQQAPEEATFWARLDCLRPEDQRELYQQEDQAHLVCVNRAEAASVAGTAAMPTGYGLGGAIASGISKGITSNRIQTATINSCMAEFGYAFMKISEFEARCPRRPPPPPVSTPAPARKK